jgi:hypothetical protein
MGLHTPQGEILHGQLHENLKSYTTVVQFPSQLLSCLLIWPERVGKNCYFSVRGTAYVLLASILCYSVSSQIPSHNGRLKTVPHRGYNTWRESSAYTHVYLYTHILT